MVKQILKTLYYKLRTQWKILHHRICTQTNKLCPSLSQLWKDAVFTMKIVATEKEKARRKKHGNFSSLILAGRSRKCVNQQALSGQVAMLTCVFVRQQSAQRRKKPSMLKHSSHPKFSSLQHHQIATQSPL